MIIREIAKRLPRAHTSHLYCTSIFLHYFDSEIEHTLGKMWFVICHCSRTINFHELPDEMNRSVVHGIYPLEAEEQPLHDLAG